MVTPGSSFEQTMMGWSPRCYIPSFMKIGLPVLEKKILKVFLFIYGRGGHLGHVTQMPRTNFRSPFPRRLHIKVGFDRASGLEKKMFEIVNDDGRHGRTDARP